MLRCFETAVIVLYRLRSILHEHCSDHCRMIGSVIMAEYGMRLHKDLLYPSVRRGNPRYNCRGKTAMLSSLSWCSDCDIF
jgi:hypothetical protein